MKTYISYWWCWRCAIVFRFISDRFYADGVLSCTECKKVLYPASLGLRINKDTNKEIEVDLR